MKVLCPMLQRPFLSRNTRHNSGSQQNLNIPPFLSTFSFSFTISVSSNLSKMLLSLWLDQFLVFAIREMFFFPTHTWGKNINIPLCSPTGCCSPTQHALSLWIVVPYSQLVNQDAISKAWGSDAEEVVQLIVQKRVFNRLDCYFLSKWQIVWPSGQNKTDVKDPSFYCLITHSTTNSLLLSVSLILSLFSRIQLSHGNNIYFYYTTYTLLLHFMTLWHILKHMTYVKSIVLFATWNLFREI